MTQLCKTKANNWSPSIMINFNTCIKKYWHLVDTEGLRPQKPGMRKRLDIEINLQTLIEDGHGFSHYTEQGHLAY